MKTLRKLIMILLLGLFAQATSAQLPEHYPDAFDTVGPVGGVHAKNSVLDIDDDPFYVAKTARVYKLNGQTGYWTDLKFGQTIGVSYVNDGRRKIITNIWLLPAGYK